MQLQFIGSGDAFGSGGKLNTCFYIKRNSHSFLIDCGASSLIGLKTNNIQVNDIRYIFITHFHADHFGGIPFFMLNAQFFSKRTEPLTIIGPPNLKNYYETAMETCFPGSSKTETRFKLKFIELEEGQPTEIDDLNVTAFLVNHGNPGGPCFSYRIECENRVISYTGDTEWTDALIKTGHNADLFIAEAYFFEKKVKLHLDYKTLLKHLPRIAPKRLILTHMSDDMLSHINEIDYEIADDGKILEL